MTHPGPGGYAFSDADLNTIITGTNDAIAALNLVNSRVSGTTEEASAVNRSASGARMNTRLHEWMTDFHAIVNDLQALNAKAEGLRRVNVNTSNEAAAQAH
jgi:hypothetical protein